MKNGLIISIFSGGGGWFELRKKGRPHPHSGGGFFSENRPILDACGWGREGGRIFGHSVWTS